MKTVTERKAPQTLTQVRPDFGKSPVLSVPVSQGGFTGCSKVAPWPIKSNGFVAKFKKAIFSKTYSSEKLITLRLQGMGASGCKSLKHKKEIAAELGVGWGSGWGSPASLQSGKQLS